MKFTCLSCNTSYNIDDSKIPEKGLLVKCSVCQSQYRVDKKAGIVQDTDIADNIETGRYDSDSSAEEGLFDDQKPDLEGFSTDFFGEEEQKEEFPHSNYEGSVSEEESKKEFSFFDDEKNDLFEDEQEGDSVGDDPLSLFEDNSVEKGSSVPFDSGLFSDANHAEKSQEQSVSGGEEQEYDQFLKDLFGDAQAIDKSDQGKVKQSKIEEKSEGGVYFRKKETGVVSGPFSEDEIEELMLGGAVSEDDDISYDGFNWISNDPTGEPHAGSHRAALDDVGETFDSINFDDNLEMSDTGIFQDIVGDGLENLSEEHSIDHVFIPDSFSDDTTGASVLKKSKKTKKKGGSLFFYIVLSFSTLIVLGLIGGAFYYYLNFVRGTQGDILDNITESIAVNTGTLVDVREALNKDLPDDYMESVGILKQYLKSEDSAPSAVGLDAQVKFHLLISYSRRLESSAALNEKIDVALKKAPNNMDLIKGKALALYESKQFDEALVLVQPHAESNDQEIFYILGLIAQAKKEMDKAEIFFNQGFMQGGGKNLKIVYALAKMKYRNGDAQSATAFVNRIISENSNYLKAHLLKADILMNTDGKLDEADKLLKDIDPATISKAEDFQKADYYHKLATVAHKKGLVPEAIGYYEKAVEINKTDTSSITTIADFYVQISNSAKAMEYYDAALKIDPKYPSAVLGKTEVFILIGQSDRVYLELAKLDIKSVTDAPSLIRLGKIYYKIGDRGKAMEFYDLAIKSNPSLIEPYVAKAVILFELNRVKEVNDIAAAVEKLGKETYAFNLIKAVIHHEEAEYAKAQSYFIKAVERNVTGDERVFFYYGMFLVDKQSYNEAAKMLERAYKIDPRNYSYIQSYAESLEKAERWKAVTELLESGTFNEKRMYRSFVSLSNAFYHLKRYEESLNNINRALELNNQQTHVFYTKAKIYFAMERYDEAEKEIDTAVIIDMKNFDNYMLFAKILAKKGDFKGAIEKIEAAEKIDSTDQQLMLMKGIIYKNLDDYRSALASFRKVTKSSLIREAYLEIGESYLQLNRTKEALSYFKKAENSGNRFAHKHLARIYYETGKIDQAVTYYRKALRADKNDMVAMRQLGYIYKEKQEWARALSYFKMYQRKISDVAEKSMIDEEVYFLEQNLPKGAPARVAESVEELDENDVEAINERAKELYIEGRALREEDPDTARERFREVMRIVPKTNEYYKKAFKAFNRLNRAEE